MNARTLSLAAVIVIRPEQVAVFEEVARTRFFAALRDHAQFYFAKARELDAPELDALLHDAVTRAGEYGIVGKREVTLWLNLVFFFGRDFDTEQPWAVAALHDARAKSPRIRMSRLYRTAVKQQGAAS